MSEVRVPALPRVDRWQAIVTAVAGIIITGMLGWFGSQLVAMRDDIHTLNDKLPSLEARVSKLEGRQDRVLEILEDRLANPEPRPGP